MKYASIVVVDEQRTVGLDVSWSVWRGSKGSAAGQDALIVKSGAMALDFWLQDLMNLV